MASPIDQMTIGLAAMALGGAAMMMRGLQGRRRDNNPTCRRCRFDLVGLTSNRCPECGAYLASRRSIRVGNRARRPLLACFGGVAMAVCGITAAGLGFLNAANFDWSTIKPDWLLNREVASPDDTTALKALSELTRRLIAGNLGAHASEAVIEQALLHQKSIRDEIESPERRALLNVSGDYPASRLTPWLDALDLAAARHGLLPGQGVRYVRQGLNPGAKLRTSVAAGGWMPFESYACDNMGIMSDHHPLSVSWNLVSVRAAGRELKTESEWTTMRPQRGMRGAWNRGRIQMDLAPGDYEVTMAWQFDVAIANSQSPIESFVYTQASRVTVVHAETPVVALVLDDALEPKRAIPEIDIDDGFSPPYLSMTWETIGASTPFDCMVQLRYAGKSWNIGRLLFEGEGGLSVGVFTVEAPTDLLAINTVDVVLIPDRMHAAEHTLLEYMWGREMIERAVPVARRSAAAKAIEK